MASKQAVILLGEASLKRLSFHWYWGLVITTNANQSLWPLVKALVANSTLEYDKRVKINQIQNRWFAPLYWFFNIDNYRTDSYLFNAYCSYCLFQTVYSQLDGVTQQTVMGQGYYSLDHESYLNHTSTGDYRLITTSYNPLENLLAELAFTENGSVGSVSLASHGDSLRDDSAASLDIRAEYEETQSLFSSLTHGVIASIDWIGSWFEPTPELFMLGEETENDEFHSYSKIEAGLIQPYDNFIVKPILQSRLKRLGITDKEVGDTVTLAAFKKAYFKSMLETHPDKTLSSTEEAFEEVQIAYNYVLCMSDPNISEEDKHEHFMVEIQRNHKKIRAQQKEIGAKQKEIGEELDKIGEEQDKIDEEQDKILNGFSGMKDELARLDKKLSLIEEYVNNSDAVNSQTYGFLG